MRLSPRYDAEPALTLDGPVEGPRATVVRQRRRLGEVLSTFDAEQWGSASRCEGWSVQDVVNHLITTNGFWCASISGGVAGEPTRILANFDPAGTPPLLIDPMRSLTPAETLDQFLTTNQQLFDIVEALDIQGWEALAEAPPGHVPVHVVAQHALWDSWTHERDILLPLGLAPAEEADEVASCLRYAAGIGPAIAIADAAPADGGVVVVIKASDPDVHVVVEAGHAVRVHGGGAPEGAPTITGPAVDLVEAFTFRQPFPTDIPAEVRWLSDGLAAAFDAPTS